MLNKSENGVFITNEDFIIEIQDESNALQTIGTSYGVKTLKNNLSDEVKDRLRKQGEKKKTAPIGTGEGQVQLR